jgi:hypothetical protein
MPIFVIVYGNCILIDVYRGCSYHPFRPGCLLLPHRLSRHCQVLQRGGEDVRHRAPANRRHDREARRTVETGDIRRDRL